jgi:hypothetical protein
VVEREIRSGAKQGKFKATCGVPECGKEFDFETAKLGCLNYLPPSSSAVTSTGLNCGNGNCGTLDRFLFAACVLRR